MPDEVGVSYRPAGLCNKTRSKPSREPKPQSIGSLKEAIGTSVGRCRDIGNADGKDRYCTTGCKGL